MTLYEHLKRLGPGSHQCKPERTDIFWIFSKSIPTGWVTIQEERDNCMSAIWHSDANSHRPICGNSAFSVEVDSEDKIKHVHKSALSMWPVRDKREQSRWHIEMLKLVKEIPDA